MRVQCSQCSEKIEENNINVTNNIAYCLHCGALTTLSSLLEDTQEREFNKYKTTSGVKFCEKNNNWRIEISLRGTHALFLVPFTTLWAGGSLVGMYTAPFMRGEFNLEQLLFGIPFILGSLMLVLLSIMSIWGKITIGVKNGAGFIFTGVGHVGCRRRFDWHTIRRIKAQHRNKHSSSSYHHHYKGGYIYLEGNNIIRLGFGLNKEQLNYIANFLKEKIE